MKLMEEYRNKLKTAEQAVSGIQPGDTVDYVGMSGAPVELDRAIAARAGELNNVTVRVGSFPGITELYKKDPEGKSFRFHNLHLVAGDRKLYEKGFCDYIPNIYSERPLLYDRYLDTDYLMVRTAPMDARGYFNYGLCNSDTDGIMKRAKKIVVEVNENMPYCYGGYNESVHISRVHTIVESGNSPAFTISETEPSETDQKIASLLINEIHDGSCIQLGIGSLPNAVGKLLVSSDLKDLGVHTEMMADAYVDLFEAGKITGLMKNTDPGKMVYTFALGTKRLYDFLHHNAACASFPVRYVNSVNAISANDRMISINNALEVDLFGQVSSESHGGKQISGTGGQWDYHYGSFYSKEGKSFICLHSTHRDKDGTLRSRIVPSFSEGTVVTIPRSQVFNIATEYGIVNLKGKSVRERAEALISIAHPDFRDSLVKEGDRIGIWRR